MTETAHDRELLHVSLDLWHPGCWGIESTDRTRAGLVGHGAAINGQRGYERCTIYGDSPEHLSQAIDVAHDSAFIETIQPLEDQLSWTASPAIGVATQDVFIEYDATEGIGPAFLSRGFLLDSHYRVERGLKTWELLVYAKRPAFKQALDTVREQRDADITLKQLSPVDQDGPPRRPPTADPRLIPRQHEALELARRRGYYEWPREVSARDLATELDVSKTTFLEHLRTAEATLLGERDQNQRAVDT